MKRAVVLIVVLSSGLLASCAYRPGDVADPDAITLRSAVFDVADTLAATKLRTANRDKVGLYVDSATVVFNVSSKSTESDSLKIDASAPKILGLGVSAQSQLVDEGLRGNTVTIVFKNVASGKLPTAAECKKNPSLPGCSILYR